MIVKSIILYVIFINLLSFAFMGIDKYKAAHHKWRVPERSLFLSALLLGGIGGTLGMYFFHHKTKHWYFQYGFPLIALFDIFVFVFIYFKIFYT